jgi:BldD-like DNA-binding protein/helix-turn-helix protein
LTAARGEPSTEGANDGKLVDVSDLGVTGSYARRVGERLRTIRRQKGMSLHEVESASGQEFKASVLGAYERGERAISVPRLQRLARFYNVPVDQLLPPAPEGGFGAAAAEAGGDGAMTPSRPTTSPISKVTIDLTRLEGLSGPEADMLHRYAAMIQMQRQDFNGRVLTIRGDDLRTIACLIGTDINQMVRRLDELGLRSSA